MRLLQYLTEKYYDSVSGGTEIFTNPSKRDMKEMEAVYGYRFFIDFRKKTIYMFEANTYHRDVTGTSGKRTKVAKALVVTSADGKEITDEIIQNENGKLSLKKAMMPAMISMDKKIVLQDCLCYLLEDY